MLKELLKNTKFRSVIRDFHAQNKEKILDIILFGSAVRGKEHPSDIDLLLLCVDTRDAIELGRQLRLSLEKKGFMVSVTPKAYASLFEPAFVARESFISEGYSLINGLFIGKGLGFEPVVLFRYELKEMSKSERMRFYYGLYGRNGKGVLHVSNARKFSDAIIVVPVERSEEIKAFLDTWKREYLEIPVLIPKRVFSSKEFGR